MNEINVYSKKDFDLMKRVCKGIKTISDESLKKTLDKGLCYQCEIKKPKFPTEKAIIKFNILPRQAILCEDCFVKKFIINLKEIQMFGSLEIIKVISEEKQEKNKQKATKIIEDFERDKYLFIKKYEYLIINQINFGGENSKEFMKFFEDN